MLEQISIFYSKFKILLTIFRHCLSYTTLSCRHVSIYDDANPAYQKERAYLNSLYRYDNINGLSYGHIILPIQPGAIVEVNHIKIRIIFYFERSTKLYCFRQNNCRVRIITNTVVRKCAQ